MDHAQAERLGPAGSAATWSGCSRKAGGEGTWTSVRVLATRTPAEWGAEYHLYRTA